MEERVELVEVGDGVLEVEVSGHGEPVLVIQTALSADELRPLSRHLARAGGYQVLHYHRRGFAGSSPATGPASMARDAADAGALVRAMGAVPAHVVGASYSAAVALVLAGTQPDVVHTLSVVEPPPTGTTGTAEFQAVNRALVSRFEAAGALVALDEFMTMLVGTDWREVTEREAPGSVTAMERDSATFFGSDVPALVSWRFDVDDAERVRCPVLYVGGERTSPVFAEMRTRVMELLPHADEATVIGATHLVAGTHPSELGRLLVRHLRRHPR